MPRRKPGWRSTRGGSTRTDLRHAVEGLRDPRDDDELGRAPDDLLDRAAEEGVRELGRLVPAEDDRARPCSSWAAWMMPSGTLTLTRVAGMTGTPADTPWTTAWARLFSALAISSLVLADSGTTATG